MTSRDEEFSDHIGSSLADFIVSFAIPTHDGKAEHCGTGTLVSIGSHKGILTASHVAEHLLTFEQFGLVRFPLYGSQEQSLKLETFRIDSVILRGEEFGEDGPDIAFLKLWASDVAAIEARNLFLNLDKRRRMFFEDGFPDAFTEDVILGSIREWTEEVEPTRPNTTKIKFGGLTGTVSIGESKEVDGYDYFFAPVEFPKVISFPNNFQGLSGASVWRVFFEAAENEKFRDLCYLPYAVAFFQTPSADGRRSLICHGPVSLYGKLYNAVVAKWPE